MAYSETRPCHPSKLLLRQKKARFRRHQPLSLFISLGALAGNFSPQGCEAVKLNYRGKGEPVKSWKKYSNYFMNFFRSNLTTPLPRSEPVPTLTAADITRLTIELKDAVKKDLCFGKIGRDFAKEFKLKEKFTKVHVPTCLHELKKAIDKTKQINLTLERSLDIVRQLEEDPGSMQQRAVENFGPIIPAARKLVESTKKTIASLAVFVDVTVPGLLTMEIDKLDEVRRKCISMHSTLISTVGTLDVMKNDHDAYISYYSQVPQPTQSKPVFLYMGEPEKVRVGLAGLERDCAFYCVGRDWETELRWDAWTLSKLYRYGDNTLENAVLSALCNELDPYINEKLPDKLAEARTKMKTLSSLVGKGWKEGAWDSLYNQNCGHWATLEVLKTNLDKMDNVLKRISRATQKEQIELLEELKGDQKYVNGVIGQLPLSLSPSDIEGAQKKTFEQIQSVADRIGKDINTRQSDLDRQKPESSPEHHGNHNVLIRGWYFLDLKLTPEEAQKNFESDSNKPRATFCKTQWIKPQPKTYKDLEECIQSCDETRTIAYQLKEEDIIPIIDSAKRGAFLKCHDPDTGVKKRTFPGSIDEYNMLFRNSEIITCLEPILGKDVCSLWASLAAGELTSNDILRTG